MNGALEYIEENLTNEIDFKEAAKLASHRCHAFIPIRGRQPCAGLNFSSERQGVPFWDKPDSGYGMSPFLINL